MLIRSHFWEFLLFFIGEAMIGRFIGAYLTRVIKPGKVLAVFALLAASMVAISINTEGLVAGVSILAVGLLIPSCFLQFLLLPLMD